jgi:hypothetical protein
MTPILPTVDTIEYCDNALSQSTYPLSRIRHVALSITRSRHSLPSAGTNMILAVVYGATRIFILGGRSHCSAGRYLTAKKPATARKQIKAAPVSRRRSILYHHAIDDARLLAPINHTVISLPKDDWCFGTEAPATRISAFFNARRAWADRLVHEHGRRWFAVGINARDYKMVSFSEATVLPEALNETALFRSPISADCCRRSARYRRRRDISSRAPYPIAKPAVTNAMPRIISRDLCQLS